MKHARVALALIIAALPFGACECSEPLSRLAPKIAIGDAFDPTFSICADSEVRECAYDFGGVQVRRAGVLPFVIRNPSPVDLVIRSITFAPGSDPAFSIDGPIPTRVGADAGVAGEPLTIKFAPQVASTAQATLIIDSDAENLLPGEKVEILLTGTGLDVGAPRITVNPEQCEFGDVGVGATAFCDLSIANVGEQELLITGVGFSAETPFPMVFGPGTTPGVPANFPVPMGVLPGTAISVRLYARPTSTAVTTGGFVIQSTDPGKPELTVPLSVTGADTPTAVARIKSINGITNNDPNPLVEPLDDVVLSADLSSAARAGGSITQWRWDIIEQPAESALRLSAPTEEETGFRFDSALGIVSGVDVAGTFVVRLTVTDDLGASSSNDARVTINAIPRDGLHIQMTWDQPENDIDLHLVRNAATNWCSSDDCYYMNCGTASGLNWDQNPARRPHLDIDDVSGFGPENINIESPADGVYTVGVAFFGGDTPAVVTVKVFIGGALRGEYFQQFTSGGASGDFWEPARIEWNAGGATVVDLNSFDPDGGMCGG